MSRSGLLKECARGLDEEVQKQHMQQRGDTIENATGIRPKFGAAPDVPDYPPCDCCGKEFEGKLNCAGCTCVFYCSKECQRHDWKVGGHKSACDTMMQQCENAATGFLDVICDETCPFEIKIKPSLWLGLDGAGAYKIALDLGLNGAIQKVMEDEIENVEDRFRSGTLINFTLMLMGTLFRAGSGHNRIDAYRIKKYVRSSDDAFERWFEASLKNISIFLTEGIAASRRGDNAYFWTVQRSTENVAAGWSMVFANTKASKAILLGNTKEADENAKARAKWIIRKLKNILPQFPYDSPDEHAIESLVNNFTAMIQIRLENFGVDVGDFMLLLGLKGARKKMYIDVALPFAGPTIQKGRALTNEECKDVFKAHAQSIGTPRTADASASTSIRGKKKGKRRARK
mmetsp:Transcript_28530/g.52074  ORF Transcript_28530/g.52074 Transcript_28530/m.52074 type:complete len:401 (-) Transcript_28530:37-1239(-)